MSGCEKAKADCLFTGSWETQEHAMVEKQSQVGEMRALFGDPACACACIAKPARSDDASASGPCVHMAGSSTFIH